MNKDEGQQWPYQAWENGGNGAIVRYRRDGSEPQMADADYLNALQQQETPVLQKLSDGWWLTDGVESFKMTSELAAKTLASYLNQKQPS